MASQSEIQVEVVIALPDRAVQCALRLPAGSRVRDALQHSGFDKAGTGVDVDSAPVGIFGEVVTRNTALSDGDRVEIYRPLLTDPKAARRGRARQRRK